MNTCPICGKPSFIQVGRMVTHLDHLACVEKLKAELAALKARNCLTCKHMPHTADEQCGQMVGWHMVSEEWGLRNRVLTACSEWEARP